MATNPPITIGELATVPAPGSGVKSDWCQSVTRRTVHRFATVAARDAAYPAASAGAGAVCVTLDTLTVWTSNGTVWGPIVPGAELLYSQIVANVSITATTQATAQNVVNPGNVTYDGAAVWVEFYAPGFLAPAVASGQIVCTLWDANTDLSMNMAASYSPSAIGAQVVALGRRKITPTAGAHNYNVRAWISPSGAGTIVAGSVYPPAYLRVTRA
jgi:hypothetical protein